MFKTYNSGFSSFQPDMFDPSISRKVNNADNTTAAASTSGTGSAYTTAQAKPGQKMQINLTINNGTNATMTAELFQWLDSVTKRLKPELVVGNYAMIPMTSHEGIRALVANTGGVVGFDKFGNLNYYGNDATPDPVFQIGCSEVSYCSLFNASGIIPFRVSFIRETVATNNQIDQKITWFKRTIAGGVKQNTVSPRAYFRPNQYQNLTIDIPVEFDVNIDSGIQLPVLTGGLVTLALFIEFWTYQDLS